MVNGVCASARASRSCSCNGVLERTHGSSTPTPQLAKQAHISMQWVRSRYVSPAGYVDVPASALRRWHSQQEAGMQGSRRGIRQFNSHRSDSHSRDVTARAVGASPGKADVCIEIGKAYARLQRPARYNMTYTKAMESFRGWCVLAYECGYREEDLLLKLTEACDNSKSPIPAASVPCCLEGVCLIWETLEQSAKPIRRWAKDASKTQWQGFVALICRAYFEQRMAAYPLDRLHLELAASGRLEADGTVAEWSRLVFDTLNTVAPQFPKK